MLYVVDRIVSIEALIEIKGAFIEKGYSLTKVHLKGHLIESLRVS